jgi:hypothetical protein
LLGHGKVQYSKSINTNFDRKTNLYASCVCVLTNITDYKKVF